MEVYNITSFEANVDQKIELYIADRLDNKVISLYIIWIK